MIELRNYQHDAVDRGVKHFRSKSGRGGVLILPTGSGKSLVIASIAKELDAPTLVFQPGKEILEQNFAKYIQFGGRGTIYSASMNKKSIANVTFATIGSVQRKPELFQRFKYVMIDECHLVNSKGGMYKQFLSEVGDRLLGLTATPYRLTTDGFGGSILKFLTRTRPGLFNRVLYAVQNQTLFDAGFLCPIEYDIDTDFDSGQLDLNTTGADFTGSSMRKYFDTIDFGGKIIDKVDSYLTAGRRHVLVFTSQVKEAQAIASAFGSIAATVSAETKPKDRAKVINDFRSGRTQVVTNVGILTTGFDFPALDAVVGARPTMSLALYYQMIGRGIRTHPTKESLWYADMVGNHEKFGDIETLRVHKNSKGLPVVSNNGKQLTNVYFGDAPFAHRRTRKVPA